MKIIGYGAASDGSEQTMRLSVHCFGMAATAGLCALALAGCGKNPAGQAAVQSQIVAHVGDEVITTNELENEFRLANVTLDKEKDPETVRRILSELVLRKYLLGQAVSEKLDREPGILLELLRAREQVLSNAFLTRAAASKAPGKPEIDKFIANNPSRFSGRKLLKAEEIVFALGPASQPAIEAGKNAKSLDDIDQQLTSLGLPHNRQTGVLSSSDLTADLYGAVEARQADQLFFVRAASNGIFFKVASEQPSPLEGAAAENLARQLMRADAVKAEQGMAAYSANIETRYEGEYAKIMQPNNASKSRE